MAIYGNSVNRAVVLTHKYFSRSGSIEGALTTHDREWLLQLEAFPEEIASINWSAIRFPRSIGYYVDLARLGNTYLAELSLGK